MAAPPFTGNASHFELLLPQKLSWKISHLSLWMFPIQSSACVAYHDNQIYQLSFPSPVGWNYFINKNTVNYLQDITNQIHSQSCIQTYRKGILWALWGLVWITLLSSHLITPGLRVHKLWSALLLMKTAIVIPLHGAPGGLLQLSPPCLTLEKHSLGHNRFNFLWSQSNHKAVLKYYIYKEKN